MTSFLDSIKKKAGIVKSSYKNAYKNPKGFIKEASKAFEERKAKRKSKKNLSKIQDKLIIAKAQKDQVAKYGQKMTESQLRAEGSGGLMSEQARYYLKNKDKYKKEIK